MSPRHVPGQRLTEGPRVRDTQAIARAGCQPRQDNDHGENYDGEDALWPEGWDIERDYS